MKRILLILLISVQPLLAAMSDAAARKKAKDLWGDFSMIGQIRAYPDTNWWKYVGLETKGCRSAAVNFAAGVKAPEFLVFGKGFNTWDAAFTDAEMNPPAIVGPFSGTIQLGAQAWDNVALTSLQWVIDGNALAAVPINNFQTFVVTTTVNTTTMTNGIHYVCATIKDSSQNVRVTDPYLFKTDQSVASIMTVWQVFNLKNVPDPASPVLSRIDKQN